MLAAVSCAGTSFYAPRVTRIWPYKIICYNVCVYVFVQKIYIHSMSCSLTIALDARDSNKMSMNVLGTYLQIFFAYTQNSISTKTKEEKKIAQGHTHLPILAKFFYLMPSHFFSLVPTRSVWSCAFLRFLAIAFAFVSRLIICCSIFILSLQPLFLRTHEIH